ncbi:MAG: hypothetical protein KF830_17860 [Planctomycetes bacterium]|nr:hypothetical protein [Planctomycetota bacterium]
MNAAARGAGLLLLGLGGCHVAPAAREDGNPPAAAVCRLLLDAPPAAWTERLPAVHALGTAAVPPLLALLEAEPGAPGAPAAVAVLGRSADPAVVPYLVGQVQERTPLAVEAALALGELRVAAAAEVLQDCVADPAAEPTLRTAAACALVRCGRPAAAAALLEAVVLAGTPAGQASSRALGLPVRSRWALERYLIERLLVQEGQADLAAAFDTDAPWSDLEPVAARLGAWLRRR